MHSEPSTNPSSRRRPISELVSARAIRIRARAAQHHFLRRLLFSAKIARVFRTSAIFVAVGDNPPGSALSRSIERAVAVEGRRQPPWWMQERRVRRDAADSQRGPTLSSSSIAIFTLQQSRGTSEQRRQNLGGSENLVGRRWRRGIGTRKKRQ
jgi:hypothetical protein